MTEEEIIAYLQEAREFAFSNSTAFECVILGGACCLSWGATKLETDLLFGGMDDVDGSIKVKNFKEYEVNVSARRRGGDI